MNASTTPALDLTAVAQTSGARTPAQASAPKGGIYRFHLRRGASGTYVGELVDDWGWVIAIKAQVVERDGAKVFEGIGSLTNATAGVDEGKIE